MISNPLVEKKDKKKLIILAFSMVTTMIFEILGIGLIPIYIFSLLSIENINNYIPNFLSFLKNFEKDQLIIVFSTFIVFFFLIKNIFQIILYKIEASIIMNLIYKNSTKIFDYYINRPLLFHFEINPSKIIKNITAANRQAGELIRLSINIFKEIGLILILMISLLYIDYKITITLIFLLIIFSSFFYFKFKKPLIKMGEEVQDHQDQQIKILNHSFNGIREVKIFKNENYMKNIFNKEIYGFLNKDYISEYYSKLPRIIFELLAIVLIIFFVLYLILQNNKLVDILPLLSLYSVVLIKFIPSFTILNASLNQKSYYREAYNIISIILKNILKEKKVESKIKRTDIKFHNDLKFEISFNNVSFTYPSRKNYKVLNDINLKISRGDMLGIFGKSGEGKSTIIDLLMGLIEPNEGTVECNEKNISLDSSSWFDNIGYVPQHVYLFDDTLLKNITFGIDDEDINMNRVQEVIKDTNLDSFVKNLHNGLNTKLGNMGANLSGGQIQRIGIARALYRNPEMLILDEPTSAVDKDTEREILSNLKGSKFSKKIIVIISHNLRILKNCNKAILLKNKKIFKEFNDSNIKKLSETELENIL